MTEFGPLIYLAISYEEPPQALGDLRHREVEAIGQRDHAKKPSLDQRSKPSPSPRMMPRVFQP